VTPSSTIRVNSRISIRRDELQFSFVRSSGPGGQNVNKVASKAVLRWAVTRSPALPAAVRDRFVMRYGRRINDRGELVLSSQRYRDQSRNVDDCVTKLMELVRAVAAPPRPRKKTAPPPGAKEKRLREKRSVAEKKQRRRRPPTTDM
jgi:ribosome-associated protein